MTYLIGLIIALFITLTGVGAGTITVPILVLFLGVPAPVAVSIGLMFAAVVKLILVPAQIVRGNVAWRTLGYMLLGGIPGVLIGSLFLKHLITSGSENVINAILGAILVTTATWQILFSLRPVRQRSEVRDRSRWLSWLMFPVGAEVGFSSAGAGALGTLALLSLTPLTAAQVVATDVCFGLVLSLVGGGFHWGFAGSTPAILWPLVAGGLAGGIASVYLAGILPSRPLRAMVCLWLIVIGGQLCWKGLGL